MQDALANILDGLGRFGLRVLGFAVAIAVLYILYVVLRQTVQVVVARAAAAPLPTGLSTDADDRTDRMAQRRRRLDTVAGFALRLVRWTAYAIATMAAVSSFAPALWDAIGGLGVAFGVAIGGAVGFGAQQLVHDYLNGILILGENPFSVGDVVAIAGVRGTVEEVGIRRTVVRDMDGTVHSIPNSEIRVASNFTRTFARINERILVALDTDIDRATALIDAVGREMAAAPAWSAKILEAPAVLRVEPVADPGIPILVQGMVRPGEQWAVAGELRRRVLASFAANGVGLATARRLVLDRGADVRAAAADDPAADAEYT